jgi:Tfp pilus assembly PilM family ATPase
MPSCSPASEVPERFRHRLRSIGEAWGENMQSALLSVARRFAAGFDITPVEVRMVVVSRRIAGGPDVRIDHLAVRALDTGAVDHIEFIRPELVSRALRDLREAVPMRRALASMRYAMALPPAATYVGIASLAELIRRTPGLGATIEARAAFDRLEPAVLAEAERLFSVDPASIAVDWLIADREDDPDAVTITATPREWLDMRIETAAAADIVLSAIDGEAAAALRACRLFAALELPPRKSWCAIWAGGGTVHAWLLHGTMVRREWRAPRDQRGPVVCALRDAFAHADLAGAVVAGDLDAIAAAGLEFDALRAALGCDPQLFCAAPFCHASLANDALCGSPAFAVAFGLAMRGVLE